jgi:uncharacterized protein YbaA (DUF1428 family)
VIDNEPITISGEDLWIALNYQLIHLVDFLPVANWSVHQNDTSFILFRDLYDLLEKAGKREAIVGYTPTRPSQGGGRAPGVGAWLIHADPGECQRKMAAKSVARFLGAHRALASTTRSPGPDQSCIHRRPSCHAVTLRVETRPLDRRTLDGVQFRAPPTRRTSMNYVDGFVIAVPTAKKDTYLHHATVAARSSRTSAHGDLWSAGATTCPRQGHVLPDGREAQGRRDRRVLVDHLAVEGVRDAGMKKAWKTRDDRKA